jgi:hypothetical protein
MNIWDESSTGIESGKRNVYLAYYIRPYIFITLIHFLRTYLKADLNFMYIRHDSGPILTKINFVRKLLEFYPQQKKKMLSQSVQQLHEREGLTDFLVNPL